MQQTNYSITTNKKENIKKNISIVTISALSIALLSIYWNNNKIITEWFASTFDSTQFKRRLLETLQSIDKKGNTGLLVYVFAFAWWEVFGLPSSIVETVAGMAFGLKRAFIVNAIGKYLGSMLAFFIGRLLLYDTVKNKLATNEVFTLLQYSITQKPLRSALFMRYSSFPGLMKNFGLSVMPLHYSVFALAIFIHGVPYSLLWAYIGFESKMRLNESYNPTNRLYEGLLLFSGVFGIFGSPSIVAYWMYDMKKCYDERKKTKEIQ